MKCVHNWKKKKKTNEEKIEQLEKTIQQMKEDFCEKLDKACEETERLERIIKHSKNKPSFELRKIAKFNTCYVPQLIFKLYLYVDKEEYIIELEDLRNSQDIDCDTAELKVKNNIAYFTVLSGVNNGTDYKYKTKYKFVIEYQSGKYVCNLKTIELKE